jgi:hypothetical protein
MAVTPGKDAKVLVGGFDLTGYLDKATSQGTVDKSEDTRFGMASKHYKVDLADAVFSGEGFFEYDESGVGTAPASHEELKAILAAASDVTYMPSGDGFGVSVICLNGVETGYDVESALGGLAMVKFAAQSSSGQEHSKVLHVLAAVAATGNGTDLDNGAVAGETAAGGAATLHVSDIDAGTGTVKVQHSVDGTTWVDLITFDAAAAKGSQRKTVAGTVHRHVRAQHTLAGGATTFTYHLAFARFAA